MLKDTSTALTTLDPDSVQKTGMVEYQAFNTSTSIQLSIQFVQKTLTKPTRTGKQPSNEDCVKFMLLCAARRLNPLEGDAWLVGYDGQNGPEFSLITSIQALLKRAQASEDFDGMESGVIVQREDRTVGENVGDFHTDKELVIGGWAKVYRKNLKMPFVSRIRRGAREKQTPMWKADPAGMIVKCAEADALRQAFPSSIGGLYLGAELEGGERVVNEVKPRIENTEIKPPARIIEAELESPSHWSDLLKDDAHLAITVPDEPATEFAGQKVGEIIKDSVQFATAFEAIPREVPEMERARFALDAAYYRQFERRVIRSKRDMKGVEQLLIESGTLTEGQTLRSINGSDLLSITDAAVALMQKR